MTAAIEPGPIPKMAQAKLPMAKPLIRRGGRTSGGESAFRVESSLGSSQRWQSGHCRASSSICDEQYGQSFTATYYSGGLVAVAPLLVS
jgi:hypothetical protein